MLLRVMNGNEFRLIMLLYSAVYVPTPEEHKGQFKKSNSVTLNGRGQLTNIGGGGGGRAYSLKKHIQCDHTIVYLWKVRRNDYYLKHKL